MVVDSTPIKGAIVAGKLLPCRNTPSPVAFILVDMNAAEPQTSDAERFEQWVREHGKAVRGFLRASLRHAELADDLSQEVFCRAWQARHRYREEGHARAYLLRIADRLVCDQGRRGRPAANLDENGWKRHEPAGRGGEPSRAVLLAEEIGQLTAALDRLSPVQRRVLLLRYYGPMSFAEIAQTIDCPLNTTLSHCHRGLEALRKLLVEQRP
jgi:RNA polymerase sigma-70 factor, ECF subfamily